jgi:hypothetical protein
MGGKIERGFKMPLLGNVHLYRVLKLDGRYLLLLLLLTTIELSLDGSTNKTNKKIYT